MLQSEPTPMRQTSIMSAWALAHNPLLFVTVLLYSYHQQLEAQQPPHIHILTRCFVYLHFYFDFLFDMHAQTALGLSL